MSPFESPAYFSDDGYFTAPVLRIAGENSLGFLRTVFACYEKGDIFAILKPGADLPFPNPESPTVENQGQGPAHGWCRLRHHPDRGDQPAQITMTSGTEGAPKAILLSHRNLADVVDRLNTVMQVTDEIREYIGVPVQYSFGLGRVRAVSAAGGAFYLPRAFDPMEIRRLLDADEINAISAVPSLWRLILAAPEAIGPLGRKVRWIEIGSQYMSAAEKAAMKRLFPNARIVQHYGMTEASRSTFLVVSDTEGAALESVGTPMGEVGVEVADDGAIRIRGPHVALGMIGPDRRLVPLLGPDGWFQTKDRGRIDDGVLYYEGRIDDQINIAGIKVNAEALESAVAGLVPAAAGHFAIVGVPDPMRGEVALLVAEPAAAGIDKVLEAAAAHALESRGLPAAGALRTAGVEALPRTETGKIRRAELRRLHGSARVTDRMHSEAVIPLSAAETAVAETWRSIVGGVDIRPGDTFYDIGGDSLSGMQIALVMEQRGFRPAAIRATFEGQPLAEIARLNADGAKAESGGAALPDQTLRNWSLTLVRAVAVIAVLMSHWSEGFFDRLGLAGFTERAFAFFFRMGTPGFATVFGIGVGMTMLPHFATQRSAVLRRSRNAFFLVFAGLSLLTVTYLTRGLLNGRPLSGVMVSNAIYNVLVFYALMLGTAPLWMPALARLKRPVETLPLLAMLLWLLWLALGGVLPEEKLDSLLELPRLMTVGGYSVFRLGAVMLIGIAAGLWIASEENTEKVRQRLLLIGLAGMGFCATTLLSLHGFEAVTSRRSAIFSTLPGYGFYISLILFLMGLMLSLTGRWGRLAAAPRLVLQVLITVGGLALPIYVFHGLVIPAKDILILLGLPGSLALTLAMAAFLAVMGYAGQKLYRLYFG